MMKCTMYYSDKLQLRKTLNTDFQHYNDMLYFYKLKFKKKNLFNMDFYIVIWNVFIEGNLQKALFIP